MPFKNEENHAVIIIPAHNEEGSIRKLLDALTENNWADSYKIIVSCNGCTDNTASIVRSYRNVTCFETQTPSKVNAINVAEQEVCSYPRIYIDADVVINNNSVIKLIERLNEVEAASIAVPVAVINVLHSSFFVRRFYQAWQATRFVKVDGHGCGVYALNKNARKLFEDFPDLIADDGYVRYILPKSAIIRVEDSVSRVNAPRDLHSLLGITTRSKLGNIQLAHTILRKPQCLKGQKTFISATSLVNKIIYFCINMYALIMARHKAKNLDCYKWQRDNTSRQSTE